MYEAELTQAELGRINKLQASHDKLVKKLKVELCRTELATISKKFIYEALKEAEK